MRALFQVADDHLLVVPSPDGKRVERAFWGPFYEGTNPAHEGSTLMTYLPAKAPLPSTSVFESRISTHEFWRDINIQFIANSFKSFRKEMGPNCETINITYVRHYIRD